MGMLRAINKIQKYDEKKVEELKKEHEAYQETEEYKEWKKKYDGREDDDTFRYDPNPQGWNTLFETIDLKNEMGLRIADSVSRANPADGEVQAKCLGLFIKYDKSDLACRAACNIITNCTSHPKSERAIQKFVEYSKKAEFKDKDCYKNVTDNLPAWDKAKQERTKLAESSMAHAHELFKVDKSNVKLVMSAFEKDPRRLWNHDQAMKTHKTLLKHGDEASAKTFFSTAQKVYEYSPYFEGEKKDIK